MTSGATTAVIPNWNGQGMLAKLLSELPRQSVPFDRVLVVDNGSTDDSVATAERLGAEVIRLPSNQGFAPAVNKGVGSCDTPFVAVLNNDVTLHQDWLALLKPEFTSVRVAGACGKILQQ